MSTIATISVQAIQPTVCSKVCRCEEHFNQSSLQRRIITYIQEHDSAYDRFGLLLAGLLSLAYDSFSRWQVSSSSLPLLEWIVTVMRDSPYSKSQGSLQSAQLTEHGCHCTEGMSWESIAHWDRWSSLRKSWPAESKVKDERRHTVVPLQLSPPP